MSEKSINFQINFQHFSRFWLKYLVCDLPNPAAFILLLQGHRVRYSVGRGKCHLFWMKLLNVTLAFLSNSSFSSFRVFSKTTFSLKPLLSTLFVSTFSRARMQPPSARLCAAVCSSSLCRTIFDAIIIVQFSSSSSSCSSTSIPVRSKSVPDRSPAFARSFMFAYKTEYFRDILPF